MPLTARETEPSLRKKIIRRNKDGASFRDLASEFETVTYGDMCRIANGLPFPKSPIKRRELGLTALVEVQACAQCGGVHNMRQCRPCFMDRLIASGCNNVEIANILSYYRGLKRQLKCGKEKS